jgi:hypothetical protein
VRAVLERFRILFPFGEGFRAHAARVLSRQGVAAKPMVRLAPHAQPLRREPKFNFADKRSHKLKSARLRVMRNDAARPDDSAVQPAAIKWEGTALKLLPPPPRVEIIKLPARCRQHVEIKSGRGKGSVTRAPCW